MLQMKGSGHLEDAWYPGRAAQDEPQQKRRAHEMTVNDIGTDLID